MKTLQTQMAAVLHDVIEDCGVTSALLEEFIRRAAKNSIARLVKFADLEDNMDLSRMAQPTDKDRRRIEKYQAAKRVIECAITEGA